MDMKISTAPLHDHPPPKDDVQPPMRDTEPHMQRTSSHEFDASQPTNYTTTPIQKSDSPIWDSSESPEFETGTKEIANMEHTSSPMNRVTSNHSLICSAKPFGDSWSAWILLMKTILAAIIHTLSFSGFGAFYIEYVQYFQVSKAAAGWIQSIFVCSAYMFAILISWPIQKWGVAKVATFGAILKSLGLILSSFAQNVPTLYVTYGIITGAGSCLATIPMEIAIQIRFVKNRALAGILGYLGYSIGSAICSPIAVYLLEIYGWRGAHLLIAGVQLNIVPIALTVGIDRPSEWKQKDTSSLKSFVKELLDISLYNNKPFTLFCMGLVFLRGQVQGFVDHIQSRAVYQGASIQKSAQLLVVVFGINTTTRFCTAFVANCLPSQHRLKLFVLGAISGILASVTMITIGGFTGSLVGSAFCGLTMGLTTASVIVVLTDFVGASQLPKAIALQKVNVAVGILVSTPLCGWLFDMTVNYDIPYMFLGCMFCVALSLFIATTLLHSCTQNQQRQREQQQQQQLEL